MQVDIKELAAALTLQVDEDTLQDLADDLLCPVPIIADKEWMMLIALRFALLELTPELEGG